MKGSERAKCSMIGIESEFLSYGEKGREERKDATQKFSFSIIFSFVMSLRSISLQPLLEKLNEKEGEGK